MATTKKNDFKKIKELANKHQRDCFKFVTLWDYKGKKFRFTFENSNGTPCGFDYKHCIDVFSTDNDEWKHLADKKDILAFAKCEINCVEYYGSPYVLGKASRDFTEACIEYLKALYN